MATRWTRGDEQELRICGNAPSNWGLGSGLGENFDMIFGSHKHLCSEVVETVCVRYYQLLNKSSRERLSLTLALCASDVLKDGGRTGSMSLGV